MSAAARHSGERRNPLFRKLHQHSTFVESFLDPGVRRDDDREFPYFGFEIELELAEIQA